VLKNISHVYRVLALLHPYPQTTATWKPLLSASEAALQSSWYTCGSELLTAEVHPPQILSAEEFEMLEPQLHKGQYSLASLLLRKLGDADRAAISMKDFLLLYEGFQEEANEHLRLLFDTAREHVIERLAGLVDLDPS
jgi:hypothetical protein